MQKEKSINKRSERSWDFPPSTVAGREDPYDGAFGFWLQQGEDGAWDELYRRYRDELLLAVRAGMGPQLRAVLQSEDVLQSVAMAAFAAMPQFEARPREETAGGSGLRGFLHKIVRNKLVDRARHAAADKRKGAVPLTPSVSEGLADPHAAPTYSDPRYERLERALLQLPEDMRQLIQLRRFDGLSSQEVADRLGRSDDAVRKGYSRAIARLSLLMTDDGGGQAS